jgi:pimeloyl-ACP methyl ester carboxylesterase
MVVNRGSAPDLHPGQASSPQSVMFVPGIILPATLRYAPLIAALGESAGAITKELEVYSQDIPPENYAIELEVDGISRAADEAGFDRFHLYAHSAGGACALAYAATYPERLLSLALDEPATDFSSELKTEMRVSLDRIQQLPPDEQMGAFVAMQLAPGVSPPPRPSGPPPDWMLKRPAGITAFTSAIDQYQLETDRLREFQQPAYFSYGSLSNPWWEAMAERLAKLLPNLIVERYEGLHHFNTSHAAEPARVASALQSLWLRATPKTTTAPA